MQVLSHPNGRHARVWVDDLSSVESPALDQIRLMLEIPSLKGLAVMPDVHLGKGAVVGSVLATEGVVLPNVVGVDISCGVHALGTNVPLTPEMDKTFWRTWKGKVDRVIPMGFNRHKEPLALNERLQRGLRAEPLRKYFEEYAPYQLGTLGGGNHYCEVGADERGVIWLHVHSGSRHTGLRIATYYAKRAQELNLTPGAPKDLEGLPIDSELGQDYLADMAWAMEFARENRTLMASCMLSLFHYTVDELLGGDLDVDVVSEYDVHHNFAEVLPDGTVLHRKGATRAHAGQIGIIPGSMGTSSYIVRGLGNPASYQSCSHGAGRAMSRSRAKKTISEADHAKSLAGTFTSPSVKLIDESPLAYKSIDQVMANQRDLVEVVHTLRPLISLKGDAAAGD